MNQSNLINMNSHGPIRCYNVYILVCTSLQSVFLFSTLLCVEELVLVLICSEFSSLLLEIDGVVGWKTTLLDSLACSLALALSARSAANDPFLYTASAIVAEKLELGTQHSEYLSQLENMEIFAIVIP